ALSGLACPYWDRSASGLWLGLTAATTKADLCQSALEGIALLTGDVMTALRGKTEIRNAVSIDGGLTQSPYFTQFLADVLGCGLRRQAFSELTAFGCAGLAAMTLERELCPPAETAEIVMPRDIEMTSWRSRFAEALGRARDWRQA
ncbi:MAG TPA: FGGY-family carbohydrate kinase, partial [Nordella sp.]|nr:FGGY-family carbohydrate kinase [Nordella sp.]